MELLIPSFIAGLLMFLAPCTLPLLPAYLAFIGGVDPKEFHGKTTSQKVRRKIFLNGLMYVLGFSVIFVLFGVLAGLVGSVFVGQSRLLLTKIAGIFAVVMGLYMLDVLKIAGLERELKLKLPSFLQAGRPETSFALGAGFAVGWTPCIGPILASILLLASTSSTALQGGMLLAVFSLGLGLPFLAVAWGVGSAYQHIAAINRYMPVISKVGGVFLVILGVLLFMDKLGLLVAYGFEWFGFIGYDGLLEWY